jgi:hypothetical protein
MTSILYRFRAGQPYKCPCLPQYFCDRWGSGWKNSDHQARRVVIFEKRSSLSSAMRGPRRNNSRGKTEQNRLPLANFPGTGPVQGMMNRLRMMIRISPAWTPFAPPLSFRTLVGKRFFLLKNRVAREPFKGSFPGGLSLPPFTLRNPFCANSNLVARRQGRGAQKASAGEELSGEILPCFRRARRAHRGAVTRFA